MKAKIALATVSGRAYYKMVTELKRKGVPFLSLKPWDPIPLDVKVVVTTEEEYHLVAHPNVLVFKYESNPMLVIDEALLGIQGKRRYEKVIVGVDPGKSCGVVILGDDNIVETFICSGLEETVNVIVEALKRVPAEVRVVKVGDGAPDYAKELLHSLAKALPQETTMKIVSESGTSRFMNETAHRRGLRDTMSAIEIAGRKGQIFARERSNEAHS
jgi:hypothetical protein